MHPRTSPSPIGTLSWPKFHGAWNIHSAFLSQELDFFIMLSSISGVIGNRGQAAYAAANSFLDDFARYRASQGLADTSIDLGIVQEIDHVADREDLQVKLSLLSGNAALSKADVLALVKLAIQGEMDRHADHQCVAGLSFEQYDVRNPAFFWARDERFVHVRRGDDSSDAAATAAQTTPKQALQQSPTRADAVREATDALVEKLSGVLIVPVEELSREKTVVSLGLDSLVAVEVKSWIKREMDAAMSTLELLASCQFGRHGGGEERAV